MSCVTVWKYKPRTDHEVTGGEVASQIDDDTINVDKTAKKRAKIGNTQIGVEDRHDIPDHGRIESAHAQAGITSPKLTGVGLAGVVLNAMRAHSPLYDARGMGGMTLTSGLDEKNKNR